jgi:hypothetical protein
MLRGLRAKGQIPFASKDGFGISIEAVGQLSGKQRSDRAGRLPNYPERQRRSKPNVQKNQVKATCCW